MAGVARTLIGMTFASAILATLVPGVFDEAPAKAAEISATVSFIGPAPERNAATPQGGATFAGLHDKGERTTTVPTAATPPALPTTRVRPRFPVGCERLVSPLARSVVATQASRCVT